MSLTEQTATAQLALLEAGEITARELCEAYLQRIATHDTAVGAFLHVDPDQVLAESERIDRRRSSGEKLGRLAGLPVAVKDVLCCRGEPTTCGSRMLQNFRPPYNATVVQRLHDADAIILGKTNLDEFAMGGSTENSALGTTCNPWNTAFVPGGSSGGAAACVAADLAPLSLGTDTGGSIRQPASFCGVVGLKPTYGRVSRFGLVAFASSLDQIGPLARTVEDAALLLEVLAGEDLHDSTCVQQPAPPYWSTVRQPLKGLKLGVLCEHLDNGVDSQVAAAVRAAMDVYRSLGAELIDVQLPHAQYGIATYYIISSSEASSNLARYDGVHYGYRTDEKAMLDQLQRERAEADTEAARQAIDNSLVRMYRQTRSEGFGAEVKRRIMLGTYALSAGYYDAYYLKALKVRRLIRQDYDTAFAKADFLIGPVAPTAAYRIGDKIDDPLTMYLGDLFTATTNLAGIPGMSIPCGITDSGLPIGLHLQAKPFDEQRLLQAGYMYQQSTDWHTQRPPLGESG